MIRENMTRDDTFECKSYHHFIFPTKFFFFVFNELLSLEKQLSLKKFKVLKVMKYVPIINRVIYIQYRFDSYLMGIKFLMKKKYFNNQTGVFWLGSRSNEKYQGSV